MDRSRIGVLVGSGMGAVIPLSDALETLIQNGHDTISPFFAPYFWTSTGSGLLAMDAGLMGPTYSISAACATSNFCFYAAANHIRRGEADIMVAGGTEAAICPITLGGLFACKALSQRNEDPEKASRPWDRSRDGFVMGEGSGVLVLKTVNIKKIKNDFLFRKQPLAITQFLLNFFFFLRLWRAWRVQGREKRPLSQSTWEVR